jgi:hypothetical protein
VTEKEAIVVKEKSSDWWVTENLRNTPERKAAVNQLIEMMTYKRVPGSKTERKFIHEFIKPIKGLKFDTYGNMHIRVGDVPIMWSSHTDTVHEKKGRQRIGFDHKEIGVAAEDTSGSTCLGADDGVGVWHMLQMLDAGVPGLYVFHRDEEGGRKGSKWIAENDRKLLEGIKFAVALDRRGTDNFITHQMGSRCCSAVWAEQFCKLLNASGEMNYSPDSTGSFTDTASYVDYIGECTNISVGYKAAHSAYERLDLEHAFKLRAVLCSKEFIAGLKTLEAKREPGEVEVYHYTAPEYRSSSSNGYGGTTYYGRKPDWVKKDERWTKDEQEFWETWDYEGGVQNNGRSSPMDKWRGKGGGHGFTKGSYTGGTMSGTQVGKGVGKMEELKKEGPSEANPDGTAVIMLPPPKDTAKPVVQPPDDEGEDGPDDTNYEKLISLIKRNPEATLELLATFIDDSPDTIADILDADGMTYEKFMQEILEMYGVCNC